MKRRTVLKNILSAIIGGSPAIQALLFTATSLAADDGRQFDEHIRDYLFKMKHFDCPHETDVYLEPNDLGVFQTVLGRFKRIQQTIGFGHFCLLDFHQATEIAKNHTRIGAFPHRELEFCEKIFGEDGARFGFLGIKPLSKLTDRINTKWVTKIPCSGNYLYKGTPLETYLKIKKDVGPSVVLTSGIRSIAKQFLLFFNKISLCNGNISQASRSIAPPGYSFHGVGDFDVGQINFGAANFTDRFTQSTVFDKLQGLGYIDLRYPEYNLMGVRFEPWHIRVNGKTSCA